MMDGRCVWKGEVDNIFQQLGDFVMWSSSK